MSLQDLLSDFVARVNNARQADKKTLQVKKNKLVTNCCKKLTALGYFESFEEDGYNITITLNPAKLTKIKRVSTPGQRISVSYEKFPRIIGGQGFNIITTSKGVLTNNEAKQYKVGGELLFQVY